MAPKSKAFAPGTAPALRRVKRLGKRLGPTRATAHLALRYGARAALLRAFSNAKIEAVKKGYSRPTRAGNAATTIAPAAILPEDRAAVWRYLSAQTHIAGESTFWLCLNPVAQLDLCKNACLCRVPRQEDGGADAIPPATGGRQDAIYVVLHGSATVAPDDDDDDDDGSLESGVASSKGRAPASIAPDVVAEARAEDRAMLDPPLTRPRPPAVDVRPSAHAFGSLAVPEDVNMSLRRACAEANALAAFMRRELRRAAKYLRRCRR